MEPTVLQSEFIFGRGKLGVNDRSLITYRILQYLGKLIMCINSFAVQKIDLCWYLVHASELQCICCGMPDPPRKANCVQVTSPSKNPLVLISEFVESSRSVILRLCLK